MRFIPEIDIPEELLRAQEENKLVVFAGAGVSKPRPSCLPDFSGLALKAAKQYRQKRRRKEPIERFFGRLSDEGKLVHDFVAREFGDEKSRPNELHLGLLRLFNPHQKVKIVTTNFDRHFSSVSQSWGPSDIEQYYAPALPPGETFSGIVYLHGCVLKDPSSLVITDTDFGSAYLTQGYARRFLINMFQSNSVLFFGYSHDDTILTYFARALSPVAKRYAFSLPDQRERWESLRVTPIICQTATKKEFRPLQKRSLQEWAEFTQADMLTHDRRIREIVEKVPPKEADREDYILYCLRDPAKARLFCRQGAKSEWKTDWLKWLNDHKILDALFSQEGELSESQTEIANWVRDNFVNKNPYALFGIIQQHGIPLNPDFWGRIMWQLAYGEAPPEQKDLARWVTFLMRQVPRNPNAHDRIEALLSKWPVQHDIYTPILLLEYLLTPIMKMEPNFGPATHEEEWGDCPDFEVTLNAEPYWLKEVWERRLTSRLNEIWRTIAPIAQAKLTNAYRMNASVGRADDRYDPQSFRRSAIEKHPQDENPQDFDVLIDIARDTMEAALKNDPTDGVCLINAWFNTGTPLLKRIAIHSVRGINQWSADDKILWLLNRDLIYVHSCKYEVFHVIKDAYPHCSESVQRKLIERVEQGRTA